MDVPVLGIHSETSIGSMVKIMSGLTTKKASAKKSNNSATQIVARRSQQNQQKKQIPMLTADKVPAGTYHSTVAAMADSVCSNGDAAIDVVYQLTDSAGKAVQARVRYPVDGYHFNRFVDAMLDAGLEEGAALSDAVGLEEEVTIAYPFTGALGKIQTRSPVGTSVKFAPKKSAPRKPVPAVLDEPEEDDADEAEVADDDTEFDDFLEEEDFDED